MSFYRTYEVKPDPAEELTEMAKNGKWPKDRILIAVYNGFSMLDIRDILKTYQLVNRTENYTYLVYKQPSEMEKIQAKGKRKIMFFNINPTLNEIYDFTPLPSKSVQRKKIKRVEKRKIEKCPKCEETIYGNCSWECYKKIFPNAPEFIL